MPTVPGGAGSPPEVPIQSHVQMTGSLTRQRTIEIGLGSSKHPALPTSIPRVTPNARGV